MTLIGLIVVEVVEVAAQALQDRVDDLAIGKLEDLDPALLASLGREAGSGRPRWVGTCTRARRLILRVVAAAAGVEVEAARTSKGQPVRRAHEIDEPTKSR